MTHAHVLISTRALRQLAITYNLAGNLLGRCALCRLEQAHDQAATYVAEALELIVTGDIGEMKPGRRYRTR